MHWDRAGKCFRLDDGAVVGRVSGNHLTEANLDLERLLETAIASLQIAVETAREDLPSAKAEGALPAQRATSIEALDEVHFKAIEDASSVTFCLALESHPRGPILLSFTSAGVAFAQVPVADPLEIEAGLIVETISALATSKGYWLEGVVRESAEILGSPYYVVLVRCDDVNTTIGDLERFRAVATELLRLPRPDLFAMAGPAHLQWELAHRMLLYGHTKYLVGQTEAPWLEVKSRGYDCDDLAQQIELAQDVARFANGDGPGLLVLGYRTKRTDGRDLIVKHCPLRVDRPTCERYRAIIDQRVFPPVRGLSVDRVQHPDGATIVIKVPDQADASRPFLVHGAMVDGRYEGAYISIIRRRGEHSIPTSPAAIHAALATGLRVLRGDNSTGRDLFP